MMNIHELINRLIGPFETIEIADAVSECNVTIKYKTGAITSPDFSTLLVSFLNSENVVVNCSQVDSYVSTNTNDPEFVHDIIDLSECEAVELTIKIIKSGSGPLDIYDESSYVDYLSKKETRNIITELQKRLDEGFILHETGSHHRPENCLDSKIQEHRDEHCHFVNSETITATPDIFYFNCDAPAGVFFNSLTGLLSLSFIADISRFDSKGFYYKIKGYKTIQGFVKPQYKDWCRIAYNIYRWVYFGGGSIADRLGLARNIISLLVDDVENLKDHVLHSIHSNYQIYLKENVSKYIEMQEVISRQLSEFSQAASRSVDSMGDKFARVLTPFLSFYITVVIFNIIQTNRIGIIFTPGLQIVSFSIISVVFIYGIYANYDLCEQRKRFSDFYQRIKKRYEDTVAPSDLQRILNNDEQYNQDMCFVKKRQIIISVLWFAAVTIFSVMTVLLGINF